MNKPRKQTYTMDMYLNKMKDKDIRSDADVQRLAGQWKNGQMNELIYTVLTEDYIPPIILGEEKSSQLWIIDGLQRSSSLMKFKFGNYKISSAIEDPIVTYRAKKRDKKGNLVEDENGNIIWTNIDFNIKNKTYDRLPEELKKRFNEYQIETVIHEACDMKRISKLIKRYNNHTAMNAAQKAFTHAENFAREVRGILDLDFFSTKGGIYTENDRIKGNLERVVLESIMCMFHLDTWKTAATDIAKYINQNSSKVEFGKLRENVIRLGKVMTEDMRDIFTIKDSFIWLTFYNHFVDFGFEDQKFMDFLKAFKGGLKDKAASGELFDVVDQAGSTKDKAVILKKLHILELLMCDFFEIDRDDLQKVDVLEFIRENVKEDVSQEDIAFHEDNLKAWTVGISEHAKIHNKRNLPSMIAIAVYAFGKEDCLDDETMIEWFTEYESRNKMYMLNQKENYLHMKKDLDKFSGIFPETDI